VLITRAIRYSSLEKPGAYATCYHQLSTHRIIHCLNWSTKRRASMSTLRNRIEMWKSGLAVLLRSIDLEKAVGKLVEAMQ